MTKEEYEILNKTTYPISIYDLSDLNDRTLLYGYVKYRENNLSLHLYIKDRKFYKVLSDINKEIIWKASFNDLFEEITIAHNRLYPECCDAQFCNILKEKGYNLMFTAFNENREPKQYYGEIIK